MIHHSAQNLCSTHIEKVFEFLFIPKLHHQLIQMRYISVLIVPSGSPDRLLCLSHARLSEQSCSCTGSSQYTPSEAQPERLWKTRDIYKYEKGTTKFENDSGGAGKGASLIKQVLCIDLSISSSFQLFFFVVYLLVVFCWGCFPLSLSPDGRFVWTFPAVAC